MLALKLQKLTTRTLIRPSQLRFVQGSTTFVRTYKHGWKTINNPKQQRKHPPKVPSVTYARSPRVRSNERTESNDGNPEEEFPEKHSLAKVFVAVLFVIAIWIAQICIQILFHILGQMGSPVLKHVRGVIWLLQYMWENDERIPRGLKDVRGVIGEENAMWLDQYMRRIDDR